MKIVQWKRLSNAKSMVLEMRNQFRLAEHLHLLICEVFIFAWRFDCDVPSENWMRLKSDYQDGIADHAEIED